MIRAVRRELADAAITDARLQASYERCRRLNAEHGKTYYLATLLLPPAKRPYVHALYGFARYADDIVDDLDEQLSPTVRAERFRAWSETFLLDLDWQSTGDPICAAVIDTIRRWTIPVSYFADFLDSMRMDLTVTEYETHDDLARYMWGSAAVIGLQMLPILGRADESIRWDEIEPFAIDLGVAFQLTNFIRDIGEDLARGRIYLPQESLREFGVDRARLALARETATTDEPIRNLVAAEIERTRGIYRRAQPGIDLVHPTSRDCLRTAFTLYGEILDEIEACDYDLFSHRVSVGLRRRARVAAAGLVGAWSARRAEGRRGWADDPATPRSRGSAGSWRTRTADLLPARRRSSDR